MDHVAVLDLFPEPAVDEPRGQRLRRSCPLAAEVAVGAEIAAKLQQSNSNISTTIRGLVEWHLVPRISVPGSRKDRPGSPSPWTGSRAFSGLAIGRPTELEQNHAVRSYTGWWQPIDELRPPHLRTLSCTHETCTLAVMKPRCRLQPYEKVPAFGNETVKTEGQSVAGVVGLVRMNGALSAATMSPESA